MIESTGLPPVAALPQIVVTRRDYDRLRAVAENARGRVDAGIVHFLDRELDRAAICRTGVVPRDVVTMKSRVFYRRHAGLPIETRTLVYQKEDGAVGGTLPILSPLGVALLGLRAGSRMPYASIDGTRWLASVEWIAYQPEAEGRLLRAPYRYWPKTGSAPQKEAPPGGRPERPAPVVPLRPPAPAKLPRRTPEGDVPGPDAA
jgi:regulator of nucleoside diphosphate kinase